MFPCNGPLSNNQEVLDEWRKRLNEVPLQSPFPHLELVNATLTETIFGALDRHACRNPKSIAIIDASDNEKFITHQELKEKALSVASFLVSKAFQPGERATICLANCIEYAIVSIGVIAAGGCVEGMHASFKEYEMESQFSDSKPTVIITHETLLQSVMKASGMCELKAIICVREDKSTVPLPPIVTDLAEVLCSTPLERAVKVGPDDIVQFCYSSGTTGKPKGVPLSHQPFSSGLHMWRTHWETELYPKIGKETVDWYSETQIVTLPSAHLFGFGSMTLYLITGSPIVLLHKFEPDIYLRMIEKYKPRVLVLIPPILNCLAKNPVALQTDLSSVELIFSGSSSAGDSVCQDILNRYKNIKFIVQPYGMTELCGNSHLPLPISREAYKSVGVIAPYCEQMIVDTSTHRPCKVGETGELWVRSKLQMKGYLNKPEETQAIFTDDGFIKTGDLAYIDHDGLVYITGRFKNFIKVNAVQVSPVQLENLLMSHSKIADAAVIGVPDKDSGEKVCALVVKTDESLTKDDVCKFVAEKMNASNNITGGIFFVKEIPRSAPGKFQRHVLEKIVSECQ